MIDIQNLFSRTKEWDYGLILSFDLTDIDFFEKNLLKQINVKKNLSVVIDEKCRKKLLYEEQQRPLFIGSHYNLEGIRIRNGGKFHPKLFLFLNENKLEFITGSFNLTNNGFTKNLETVIPLAFDLDTLDKDDMVFLTDLKSMLTDVFIENNEIIDFCSPILQTTITNIINAPFFSEIINLDIKEKKFHFLSSENSNLFDQVINIINDDITKIETLSPFYDKDASAIFSLAEISPILDLYIPKYDSSFPVGKIQQASIDTVKKLNFFVGDLIEDKFQRTIHAKRYRIHAKDNIWEFVTSANFSRAGLTNKKGTRNFEIGILFPAKKSSFPGINKCDFIPDQGLALIEIAEEGPNDISSSDTNQYNQSKDIIKYAHYDGENILFDYDFSKIPNDITPLATLNVGESSNENLPFDSIETGGFELSPPMEIDGNQRIVICLEDQYTDWKSYPFFVSRERHEPSFLPPLGGSAFYECLRLGKEAGLDLAFQKAKESGRNDWLLYLLNHWDLAKIYQGLTLDGTTEKDGEEAEEMDDLPNIETNLKTDYSKQQFKNNVEVVLMHSKKLIPKLKNFIEELKNEEDSLNLFIRYVLPIFLEITNKYWQILRDQEKLKKLNPALNFPEYSWLNNFHNYEKFFVFFNSELIERLEQISIQNQIKSDESILYCVILSWLNKMHTSKTLNKFEEYQDQIQKITTLSKDLKERIPNDLWDENDVTNGIDDLLSSYFKIEVLEFV